MKKGRAMAVDRIQMTRDMYRAFEERDRDVVEGLVAEDFTFHAPPDPLLDRDEYFKRCWPNAGMIERFDFVRLFEHGDEVVVTYESTKSDGNRFRNTEILRFRGEELIEVEVYFGWDI
jgi:ketosteroid isomerase-like protein